MVLVPDRRTGTPLIVLYMMMSHDSIEMFSYGYHNLNHRLHNISRIKVRLSTMRYFPKTGRTCGGRPSRWHYIRITLYTTASIHVRCYRWSQFMLWTRFKKLTKGTFAETRRQRTSVFWLLFWCWRAPKGLESCWNSRYYESRIYCRSDNIRTVNLS
jgi:hypothetical protein